MGDSKRQLFNILPLLTSQLPPHPFRLPFSPSSLLDLSSGLRLCCFHVNCIFASSLFGHLLRFPSLPRHPSSIDLVLPRTTKTPLPWRIFVAPQAITLATRTPLEVPEQPLQPTTQALWTLSVNKQARLKIGWTPFRILSSRKCFGIWIIP